MAYGLKYGQPVNENSRGIIYDMLNMIQHGFALGFGVVGVFWLLYEAPFRLFK